jgi:hypothetical protein
MLEAYLADVISLEMYGDTRAGVARTLLWEGIRGLIRDGVLVRRGPLPDGRIPLDSQKGGE